MNIHHLIYIDSQGQIRIIKPSKGANNPQHLSLDPTSGYRVLHHMEPIANTETFVNTKYWDSSQSAWVVRNGPPNPWATWQSGAWVWDSNDILTEIRRLRLTKLLEADWAVLPDSPLDADSQSAAKVYRTALRDLPANLSMSSISSVDDVVWPTKPEFL